MTALFLGSSRGAAHPASISKHAAMAVEIYRETYGDTHVPDAMTVHDDVDGVPA